MGIEAAAERALEVAWNGAAAVWLSFDVDCLDAAFVPGTGWPEPGGFLPREVLKFIQLIAERPLAGLEVVECSPPYDNAEITALIATRVICDTLGCLVRAGHLPAKPAREDLLWRPGGERGTQRDHAAGSVRAVGRGRAAGPGRRASAAASAGRGGVGHGRAGRARAGRAGVGRAGAVRRGASPGRGD
jgi:hypothetical protein